MPRRVRYKYDTDPMCLTNGKEYDVLAVEDGWYRIIDDEGVYDDEEVQGYLYPPELFDVIA